MNTSPHMKMMDQQSFLETFRKMFAFSDVLSALDSLRKKRVLVIGETILDEYVYGDILGKSAKEPILVLQHQSDETHVGGAALVANHLSSFCDHVELVTYIGDKNPQSELIENTLRKNVTPHLITKSDSPTIVKRRFVDKYLVSKLLEVYEINDTPMTETEESQICDVLESRIQDCDVIIAADYGHGLINPGIVNYLCDRSKFLSVNTQINAANHGFHTLSRYPKADFVCVHEGEIRLDQRDRTGDLNSLIVNLAERMSCRTILITQGKYGSLLYQNDDTFTQCPALATRVIDRVGAGDSVLAISSLCVEAQLPPHLIGFISNMVGAQAVTIVGNRKPVDRDVLVESIQSVMNPNS